MYPVTDTLQRPLRDLRISVTDRCNMRCTYCMPREAFGKNFVFLQRAELLGFEEITRLARLFVGLGVRKLRLSGGEPLLRHGVERLIEQLARLEDDRGRPVEVALTTNGTLLAAKAHSLKDAGLTRLTVSLDALMRKSPQDDDSGVADGTRPRPASPPRKPWGWRRPGQHRGQRGVNEGEILPLVRHYRTALPPALHRIMTSHHQRWRLDHVVTRA
jgi:cyclic pyranopterin phosphate synthase